MDGVQAHTVRIEFHDEQATEVCIAGTFNEWRPGAALMIRLERGKWLKELSLPAGRYEYRLVVDGQWICDPTATEKVPNPFGDFNALLIVPSGEPKPGTNHEEN